MAEGEEVASKPPRVSRKGRVYPPDRPRTLKTYKKRPPKLLPTDFRLRDEAILTSKLIGQSRLTIAEQFNVSCATIDRALKRARDGRYLETGKDIILLQLMPAALQTIKQAIEAGDVDAAFRITDAVGITGEKAGGAQTGDVIEEFEAFRRRVIHRVEDATVREVESHEHPPASSGVDLHADDSSLQGGGLDGVRGLLPNPASGEADPARISGHRHSIDDPSGEGPSSDAVEGP